MIITCGKRPKRAKKQFKKLGEKLFEKRPHLNMAYQFYRADHDLISEIMNHIFLGESSSETDPKANKTRRPKGIF